MRAAKARFVASVRGANRVRNLGSRVPTGMQTVRIRANTQFDLNDS